MARKSVDLPTGIELRNGAIRIRFTWEGQRCSETLPFPATQQGIASASRLRDQVVSLNKQGLLDEAKYAELFPNSSRASNAVDTTFGGYAQIWLNSRSIVFGTRNNYKCTLNNWWMPALATLPLASITSSLLRKLIAATPWKSEGVKFTSMVRLNTILAAATNDGLIPRNPLVGLAPPKVPKKKVDPFTQDEVNAILTDLYLRNTLLGTLFEFAFFTGMRLGEAMALRWECINLTKKTAYVCRTLANGAIAERTKTGKPRYVLLNNRALHALETAREIVHTFGSEQEFPYCFPPSKEAKFRCSTSNLHRGWADMLIRLQIKYRPPYNARHTYATLCLMKGMKPAFIANQLGHSVQMLLSTYAEWLNDPSDWDEMGKLDIAPSLAQASKPTIK